MESGAHQRSLALVLAGEIDASAIDSTVLLTELLLRPDIAGQIRIVERLGPSPIPPWAVRQDVPPGFVADLRRAFVEMHTDPAGAALLASAQMLRFVPVQDGDYDLIRQMRAIGERVVLRGNP